MQNTPELKLRFQSAFKRYSAASTAIAAAHAALAEHIDSIQIHNLSEQWRILCQAERDYRAARLEYAMALLGQDARALP